MSRKRSGDLDVASRSACAVIFYDAWKFESETSDCFDYRLYPQPIPGDVSVVVGFLLENGGGVVYPPSQDVEMKKALHGVCREVLKYLGLSNYQMDEGQTNAGYPTWVPIHVSDIRSRGGA